MKSSLIIGRFQPPHPGHFGVVRAVLAEGRRAVIAIRDTEQGESNPFTVDERIGRLATEFGPELGRGAVAIIVIPDIDEVVHGRTPGWSVREVRLGQETEALSGTEIRRGLADRT